LLVQATYPAAYRENRFKDQYKGVHFGTLDFLFDENSTSASLPLPSPRLVMTIWDHLGDPVIVKTIPIHTSKLPRQSSSPELSSSSTCTPYWGVELTHRKVLFLFCMAVALFLLLAIPLAIIIWLVSTSIFYIWYEKETQRREAIERRYQEERTRREKEKVP
jgi:hypothetical protein